MLPRSVTAFLPRSKHLLISWLQSPLEPKKIKSVTVFTFSPSSCHEVMGLGAVILVFWSWVLSQLFHSPPSPSSRGSWVLLHFLPLEWCQLHIWGYWYFSQQSWFQLESSSLAFCVMYSAYKLNNQTDNIQPCCTPFPILNQSVVPCPVLTLASWSMHRFLRRQVR